MKRRNTQSIGEAIREFLEENQAMRGKLYENRIEQAWTEVLGEMGTRYTRNIYVKNRILYVSLSSSVLRSELSMARVQLIKSLNEKAGAKVIDDIVIR